MSIEQLKITNASSNLKIDNDYKVMIGVAVSDLYMQLNRNQAHMLYLYLKERFEK